MRYAVVIENAGKNYTAYVPDLLGCVVTGETPEEIEAMIREAMRTKCTQFRVRVYRGAHGTAKSTW